MIWEWSEGTITFVIRSCHLLLITHLLVATFCSFLSFFHISYIMWSFCPISSAAATTAPAWGRICNANEMRQQVMVCWDTGLKEDGDLVIWLNLACRQWVATLHKQCHFGFFKIHTKPFSLHICKKYKLLFPLLVIVSVRWVKSTFFVFVSLSN